jgi:adenylate cyclase
VQFEQFFSSDLARELERDPGLLEGRVEEITVLVSDLRGFTELSQRLGADQTCRMLRDMMECLSDRIVEGGGAIVDYAGDGILAMWNAPVKQPQHEAMACQTALEMLGELPALNARWADVAGGRLALGIGINTGTAQVGNTGSRRRFKYGPHGHAVNLASRIQDATKRLGVPLLVSRRTREALSAPFAARRVGQVRLPGVAEPETLFELRGGDVTPEWLARRDRYEQALALFEDGQWVAARDMAMPLLADAESGDDLAAKLVRRASERIGTDGSPLDPAFDAGRK